ncbi:hypothetical protein EMCRGX_G005744 [Ephydatia muelleri]
MKRSTSILAYFPTSSKQARESMRGPVSAIEEQEDGVDHFSEEEFTSSKRARVSAIEEQEDGVDHFSEEEFTSSKRARGVYERASQCD